MDDTPPPMVKLPTDKLPQKTAEPTVVLLLVNVHALVSALASKFGKLTFALIETVLPAFSPVLLKINVSCGNG